MEKTNFLTESIFGDIINNWTVVKFLNSENDLGITQPSDLLSIKDMYTGLINSHLKDLSKIAKLEDIITKIRVKEFVKKEIKLSHVRGYIYARTPLFSNKGATRDIRVIVGKVSEYGDDIKSLLDNKKFISMGKQKLIDIIEKEISVDMDAIHNEEEIPVEALKG